MRPDNHLLAGSASLLVLSLLASGDKYGYEMIAALEEKSDHTFTLKEGTLYPVLHSLEKAGAVTVYEQAAPPGRRRKYYRITPRGRRLLEEKREQWHSFSALVNAVVAEGAGAPLPAGGGI